MYKLHLKKQGSLYIVQPGIVVQEVIADPLMSFYDILDRWLLQMSLSKIPGRNGHCGLWVMLASRVLGGTWEHGRTRIPPLALALLCALGQEEYFCDDEDISSPESGKDLDTRLDLLSSNKYTPFNPVCCLLREFPVATS